MEDFEKWWISQCTGGYFIHSYENDKEMIKVTWNAAKKFAYEDAIGILLHCDETTAREDETYEKALAILKERAQALS